MTDKFIVAAIGSPFGLDGFVKIRSLSGEIGHLLILKEITLLKDGKEQVLKIEETKTSPLSMRFAGIDSLEKAKALSGAQLLVERDKAAPLKEGEFYIEDLKGLPVVTREGEILGHISDIIEGGGGELAEIKIHSPLPSSQSLRLVPFRKEFFPEIIPEKGRIVIDNLWILE